jgi:peptidyl-prolyl cis-trans isomerase SurA
MLFQNFHIRPLVFAGLASALIFPFAWSQPLPASSQNAPNYIVAVVDAEPITNVDVRLRSVQLRQQLNQKGKVIPEPAELLKESLNKLIDEKALLQFAKETGIAVDEDAVNQAEQRLAAQRQLTVEELHKKTKAEGSSIARLRQNLREQITLQRLTERNVPPRIRVSDAEVEQAIRARKSAFVDPNPDVELGQIFIAVSEKTSAEQIQELQAKATQALTRLKQGEDFGVLVKAYSDGAEREKGGLMGVRPLNRYPTLFADVAQNLKVGEVSAVIRSGAGFHILKLVSKKNKEQVTVTETRARHILLRPGGKLSQSAARGQLAEYKRQIESGKEDFADLAKAHSQDASAANGGDLGWVTAGTFVPEFEEAMNKLKPTEIADPVVSRFGVHLIQLLARREAPISEKDLRDLVRNQLRNEKFEETYQMWVQEVRGRAYVELRDAPQ